MVWIHGGSYTNGAASHYDVTSLTEKGVIVVTTNYRLNYFGFLSTEDDVMPGNYGMLDLIAALKWIKKNIKAFGGDPDNVTIFGESAGSGAVSLLTLSPLAKDLFQRAIMQSGVSLSIWAIQHSGNRVSAAMMTRLISAQVNCTDFDNSTLLMACLQSVDAKDLFSAGEKVNKAIGIRGGVGFITPRVETTFGFLPDLPAKLLASKHFNQVDTLRGFNTDELGAVLFQNFLGGPGQKRWPISATIQASLGFILRQFTVLDQQTLSKMIKDIYISNDAPGEINVIEIVEAMTEVYFTGSIIQELEQVSQKSPDKKHYLYEFSYRPNPDPHPWPTWIEAVHTDEINYIFDIRNIQLYEKAYNYTPSVEAVQVSQQVMTMWTNFAKTGDPSIIDASIVQPPLPPSVGTPSAGSSSVGPPSVGPPSVGPPSVGPPSVGPPSVGPPPAPSKGITWPQYTLNNPSFLQITASPHAKTWLDRDVIRLNQKLLEKLDGALSTTTDDVIIG